MITPAYIFFWRVTQIPLFSWDVSLDSKSWRVPSHQVLVMSCRLPHQEDPDILHMIERKLVSKKLETLPPSPTHVAPAVGINLEVPFWGRHERTMENCEKTRTDGNEHQET